jgi:peptidoglycan L-alanyl-D-glutamate endopeptidase CwlK
MADSFYDRIDLLLLYPPFVEKLDELEERLIARGEVYVATSGLRTFEEQGDLYARGRGKGEKKYNEKKYGKKGKYVTKARPGYSAHNYGIATDLAHDADRDIANGLQPDWTKANYEALAEEAEAVGLEAGHRWRGLSDSPHVQLPLSKHGLSMNDLYEAYQEGGIDAVHALLDEYEW